MTHAIRIHQTGGPEVLTWDEVEIGPPGSGEVLLKQSAVGLNFIDVYHRTGLYPLAELPAVIGMEGAGQIAAVGEGITALKPGDRVAYAGLPVGAYAQARLITVASRMNSLERGAADGASPEDSCAAA